MGGGWVAVALFVVRIVPGGGNAGEMFDEGPGEVVHLRPSADQQEQRETVPVSLAGDALDFGFAWG